MLARTSAAVILALALHTPQATAKKYPQSGIPSATDSNVIEVMMRDRMPVYVHLRARTHTMIELPDDFIIKKKVYEKERFKVQADRNLGFITPLKLGISGSVTFLTNQGAVHFNVIQRNKHAASWVRMIDPDAKKKKLARATDPLVELIKKAKIATKGNPPELGIDPAYEGIDFTPVSAVTYANRTFITLPEESRTPGVGIVNAGKLGMARYDVRHNVIVVEGKHHVIQLGIGKDIVCVGQLSEEQRLDLSEVAAHE